jgi:hypothetical protein
MATSIGSKIDAMWQLREQKRDLEKRVEVLDSQMQDLEHELIQHMDAEETTAAKGNSAAITISSSIKPSVEDWDAFYGYIHKHKAWHLMDRRASVTGCRELFETKGMIPGVVPFQQRRLRITTISKG